MKDREIHPRDGKSGKRKHIKRVGGSPTQIKVRRPQCQNQPSPTVFKHEESLTSNSPLPGHFYNYNDIVDQLIQRKAHYLSPNENNSSYEEWAKTQDQLALSHASSNAIEDVLKARIQRTKDKFIENLNWRTLDIVNYLISSHAEVTPSSQSTDSSKRDDLMYAQRNPIVLAAVRKKTKAGLKDKSKPGGTGKSTPKKSAVSKRSSSPKPDATEPTYPKKYQPTYKLSNYDYMRRGWTKLPDYSITYRYYTLGTEPAFPALWAFRERAEGRKYLYPNSNKVAADFEGEKPYCVYHPNGEVAISISEGRAGPRMIVYSMSKKDESGRWIESRPQAMFDSKGNGVVYDLEGKMRMNFDQIEGALYQIGKKSRPVLHWYWKESTFLRMRREDLNAVPPDRNDDIDPNKPDGGSFKSSKRKSRKNTADKPKSKITKSKGRKSKVGGRKSKVARKSVARKSMTRKSMARKSKISAKSKRSVKSARKSETPRKSGTGKSGRRRSTKKGGGKRATRVDIPPLRKKPRHPKPITEIAPLAIKITDYVSMRIMNQQHIHLDFECGPVHYRLYLGVVVNPEVVERIDKIVNPKRVDNVAPCYFELMPLRSMSLYSVNKRIQEMKKEAARREYKQNIKTIGGFYSWWLKKKRQAFEKKQDHQSLMPMAAPSIKLH